MNINGNSIMSRMNTPETGISRPSKENVTDERYNRTAETVLLLCPSNDKNHKQFGKSNENGGTCIKLVESHLLDCCADNIIP